jgi:hypothetical protein
MRRWVGLAACGALLFTSAAARSNANGRTGSSGLGGGTCNGCHNGGAPPSLVEIVGPAALDAGATATYTLRLATGAAVTGCGVASDTVDAVLAAQSGGGTQLRGGEITQAAPLAPDGGEARFTFTLTAPPFGGAVVLYGAGNACDGDGTRNGDRAAMTTLAIAVSGPPRPPPGEAGTADAGASDDAAAAADAGATPADAGARDAGGSGGGPGQSGGCAIAGEAPGALGAATAALCAFCIRGGRRRRAGVPSR